MQVLLVNFLRVGSTFNGDNGFSGRSRWGFAAGKTTKFRKKTYDKKATVERSMWRGMRTECECCLNSVLVDSLDESCPIFDWERNKKRKRNCVGVILVVDLADADRKSNQNPMARNNGWASERTSIEMKHQNGGVVWFGAGFYLQRSILSEDRTR